MKNNNITLHITPDDLPPDWSLTECAIYSLISSLDTEMSQCLASITTIARLCRISVDTARRILKKFQKIGLIVIIPRNGDTNLIRLVRDEPVPTTPLKQAQPTKKKKFIPPTFEEWSKYCESRKIRPDVAKKSFDYYHQREWKKANGQKIDNWKGTIIAVWERPENKYKNGTTLFNGIEIPL